jgi:hypothetical protein
MEMAGCSSGTEMPVAKHINFFELSKAAAKPGCPLCRLVNDRAEWYIDNLLFEHVADRGFRALHRASGGFCSFHSRNLVSFRDGLAVAILSRDILEDRMTSFRRKKSWKPKGRCPICIEKEHIEEEYLSFLAACETGNACRAGNGSDGGTPEERELREAILSSDGLCAPHYNSLLFTPKGRPRPVPKWIRDFHETKYRELLERVDRFIEFSAWGRQKEFAALTENDQLVWKEAAAALRGSTE